MTHECIYIQTSLIADHTIHGQDNNMKFIEYHAVTVKIV